VNLLQNCIGQKDVAHHKGTENTVEKDIGVPIISIIYDGITTNKNELLAPYLHYILRSFPERISNSTTL
jgi:hypothetical protein